MPDRGLRDREIPPAHRAGHGAAEKGYRVKYTLATRLVNELVEAADEKILAKTIARYRRVDLLCIDELGYMELDRRGAELLFQVLTEREEKNSIAIASNESFSGWTRTFTDPRLCAAIVDRVDLQWEPSSKPAQTPTVWPTPGINCLSDQLLRKPRGGRIRESGPRLAPLPKLPRSSDPDCGGCLHDLPAGSNVLARRWSQPVSLGSRVF